MTEAGWTATVRDKARKLYGLLHAEVSRDQVCGPEDVKAIRKMEIVDIGLLIAALDDSYQQGRAAGLVKAVEIIKANTDVKKAIEIIRLHSLAQQAQGEKGVGDANIKMS